MTCGEGRDFGSSSTSSSVSSVSITVQASTGTSGDWRGEAGFWSFIFTVADNMVWRTPISIDTPLLLRDTRPDYNGTYKRYYCQPEECCSVLINSIALVFIQDLPSVRRYRQGSSRVHSLGGDMLLQQTLSSLSTINTSRPKPVLVYFCEDIPRPNA